MKNKHKQIIENLEGKIQSIESIIKDRSSYSGFSLYLYASLAITGFLILKTNYSQDTENYLPSVLLSKVLFITFYIYVVQGNFTIRHKYVFKTRSNFKNYNYRGIRTVIIIMASHFLIAAMIAGTSKWYFMLGLIFYLLIYGAVTFLIGINAVRENYLFLSFSKNKEFNYLSRIPFSSFRRESTNIFSTWGPEDRTYRPYGLILMIFIIVSLIILPNSGLPKIDTTDFLVNCYISFGATFIYVGVIGIFYDLAIRDILNILSSIRLKVISSEILDNDESYNLQFEVDKIISGYSNIDYIRSEMGYLHEWLLVKYRFLNERFDGSLMPKRIRYRFLSWKYRIFRKKLLKRIKNSSRSLSEKEKKYVENKSNELLKHYDRYWLLTLVNRTSDETGEN